jgi:hypothetical protein
MRLANTLSDSNLYDILMSSALPEGMDLEALKKTGIEAILDFNIGSYGYIKT